MHYLVLGSKSEIPRLRLGFGKHRKAGKHGLAIGEIEEFFAREVLVAEDSEHSEREHRYVAVGRAGNGRYMFVAFTFRTKGKESLIRVISARYAHKREARAYENLQKTK
ncbi:MAG TPA: BrnT family toxin [Bdellovibrionota bacterium]|nr:BrnT family toxin [Bdellovibrionota bacterium]